MKRQSETSLDTANSVIDDCWNKIGVRGSATCPELSNHTHCRNCPTYAAAAACLLDRDLPQSYLSDWGAYFAQGKPILESETQSAVIFRIGAEWLALPTAIFQEVAEWNAIHSLPGQRGSILLGLTPVNGELLICVSLAKILDIADSSTNEQKITRRLVIIEREGWRLTFPVDEVHGVYRYPSHDQMPLPSTISQSAGTYTRFVLPWQKNTVGYLDDELLFHTVNRSLA